MDQKYQIDYQDGVAMQRFSFQNVELADKYHEARKGFALALKHLKVELAKAYRDRRIERKLAEDKAFIALASERDCCMTALQTMIDQEGEYKGLEKVLDARAGAISFNQSLIKNEQRKT
jgi:hypothetical protein